MASSWQKKLGGIAQIAGPVLGGIFGGPAGAALGGAAGGALSGKTGTLKQMGIGAGLGYGGAKLLQGVGIGGGSKTGGSNPLSMLSGLFGGGSGSQMPSGGGMNPLGSNVPSWMTGTQQASSQSQGLGLGGLLGGNKGSLLGPLLMAGSQFIKSPQVPELPQSVIDFQNAARGGNPLQNQASQALQQQLSQTQQNMGQDEIDALNRQYDLAQEDELKSVDSMYKSLRPGSDPLTDSAYQKDLGKVRDRYATLRADSNAQAQRQISNDFNSQRANQIAQASGLGQQQLQQLATLGQYDLDRQMSQLNISDADRRTLRDYLLSLGGNIYASQYQQPSIFGNNGIMAGQGSNPLNGGV